MILRAISTPLSKQDQAEHDDCRNLGPSGRRKKVNDVLGRGLFRLTLHVGLVVCRHVKNVSYCSRR